MEAKRILIVDDDRYLRESIRETLRRKGYEIEIAVEPNEAIALFSQHAFDLVISDIKMPTMTGVELLEKLKKIDPDVPVIMITAFGAVDLAVDAMKKGAHDFIQKSANLLDELEMNVEKTLQFRSLLTENKRLKSALQRQWDYVGQNGTIKEVRSLVASIASSRSTVLITGESGTGKELIARSIHFSSPRQNGPFVKVNCAALPEGLIESELFGHEKGAFTGALKDRRGKFELAHGGTLLLDEIGEMTMNMQAKLLRVLQEREINKVGGDDPLPVDVRIVVTTNRNLEEDVKNNKFREDLYYRLNVFHVHLPALRQRKDDIAALAEHFIRRYNDLNGFTVEGLAEGGLEVLRSYEWPGNIRELENAIERAVVLTRSGPITPEKLSVHAVGGSIAMPCGSSGFEFKAGITVADAERELILRTLTSCENNRTRAAEMLGISIRTLRNKLYEYGRAEAVDVEEA